MCGYCSMRNVHLKCNKCISHNQEDLMHGCEELQCLLPLLLATKRTFTLMCCKRKGNERTNGRSTILNHSYCTLASLLFCCLKTAPKTETFLTSLGEKRCTSALLFLRQKKKSLTYLLLCDNFLFPSNQTFLNIRRDL